MRHKKLHLSLLGIICLGCNVASAQLFIDQATFTIQSGATVTVQGDVTSNTDILGPGKLILKGTGNQNINLGGFTVPNLEVDNTSNVTLTGSAKVSGDLSFTNGNIIAGNNNLTVGSAGTITNAASTKFFVTNGTGRLIKAALASTAFNFPIGNSTSSYDPVSISNSGTADDIGARSFANVLSGGATGTAYTKETINNSWDISEAVAGGSNLSVTATWNTADELPGFDRNRGGLSNYLTTPAASVGWDLLNSQTGMAVGANPYTYTRTGITTTGIFAVGTRPVLSPLLVSPKVFLQGAWANLVTPLMRDDLRVANLIPTSEPYSGNYITTTLRGSGGGETAPTSIIGSAAPASDNAIVDWVLVQLHSNVAPFSVVCQRAVLLQRDGDIVDVDGVSPVNMAGFAAGTYFISVKHRNHIGVRTASILSLAKVTSTSHNFSSGLSQALNPVAPATNDAMTNKFSTGITTPVFMMWGGNANGNTDVKYSGPQNDELTLLGTCLSGNKAATVNGYLRCDLTMNGSINYSGPNNDEFFFVNRVLLGNKATVITQPTF